MISRLSVSSFAGSLWYDVCIPAHPFSVGRQTHLWFPTHTLHSLCIPAYLSLPILLTLCQILHTPRFPTEAGSRQACPLPVPVLLWERLTSPLFSQVTLWDASTLPNTSMIFHITPVAKEETVCVLYAHTQTQLCLCLKNIGRERGMLMISGWQMVEWCSEDWYYCPLKLICCYSNPQHYSKAGLIHRLSLSRAPKGARSHTHSFRHTELYTNISLD